MFGIGRSRGTFLGSAGAAKLSFRPDARAFTGIAHCFGNPVQTEPCFDCADRLLQVAFGEQPRAAVAQFAHNERREFPCKTAGPMLVSQKIAEQHHRQLTVPCKNPGRPYRDHHALGRVDTRSMPSHFLVGHTGINDGIGFDRLRFPVAVREQSIEQIGGYGSILGRFYKNDFGDAHYAVGTEAAHAIAKPALQMNLATVVRDTHLQKVAIQQRVVPDVHSGTFIDRIERITTHLSPGPLLQSPIDYDRRRSRMTLQKIEK